MDHFITLGCPDCESLKLQLAEAARQFIRVQAENRTHSTTQTRAEDERYKAALDKARRALNEHHETPHTEMH